MNALFWIALATVAYTYVGYPLLAALLGRVRPRPVRSGPIEPSVSLIICAHDEAASIGARLENALALDYPPGRLEVIVASDGSTDGTQQVAARFAARGVRVLDLPRAGKAQTLNGAVAASRGEILVFSDANSIYDPGTLRALIAPFADPEVGGVAGDQRYRAKQSSGGDGTDGERTYWNLDRMQKRWQSDAGSVTSATGAIHAIRREIFQEVPSGVTDDFWISTGAVAAGKRLVFAEGAVAWEHVAASSGSEFQRKVRVTTRGLRAVLLRRALLDPRRHGLYALQLLSHKVLRRLVVFPLLALLVLAPLLWVHGPIHQLVAVGGWSVCGAAALAALLGPRLGRSRVLSIPLYFVLINVAVLLACRNLVTGRRIDSWVPQRTATESRLELPRAEDATPEHSG